MPPSHRLLGQRTPRRGAPGFRVLARDFDHGPVEAKPNVLVLRLALETFLPSEEAKAATREMVNHPVLIDNRFKRW